MERAEPIAPDTRFIRDILQSGGGSLKKCFQCGNCSVVCSLSPADNPFPRKEMVWAQWGLKDRLLRDPDIWLCHGCNDCSSHCPRGAKPGDVLSAIRSYAITHLSPPGFFAPALAQPRYLLLFLALPVAFLLVFLAILGRLSFPQGEVVFSRFIPTSTAEITGIIVALVVLGLFAIGMGRFWKGLWGSGADPRESFLGSLIACLGEIMKHSHFSRCATNRSRYYSHLMVFYGCLLLLLATAGRAIYTWTGREGNPPLTDPVKIAGNLGGLLVFAGLSLVIYRALAKKGEAGASTYFDWFLVGALYLATLTGFATEVSRLLESPAWAYSLYIVHLVFVFTVLAYLPFSRLSHLAYRTLALTYARRIGRRLETP